MLTSVADDSRQVSPLVSELSATLSSPDTALYRPINSSASHETHDVYDSRPLTTSTSAQQRRQQEQQPRHSSPSDRRTDPFRPSSSSDSASRTLRRTPRLGEKQRTGGSRAGSVHSEQTRLRRISRSPEQRHAARGAVSPGGSDSGRSGSSRSSLSAYKFRTSSRSPRRQRRTTRISRRTASAILYALEEALRNPNPFTPDLIEEEASMSDLLAGGTTAPRGTAGNGTSRGDMPAAPGSGSGGRQHVSGVRTPSDIMRAREAKRREHEAKLREEQERQKRAAAVALQEQQQQEQRRRSHERRAAAASAAAAGATYGAVPETGQRLSNGRGHATSGMTGTTSAPIPERRPLAQPETLPYRTDAGIPTRSAMPARPTESKTAPQYGDTAETTQERISTGRPPPSTARAATGTGGSGQAQAEPSAPPSSQAQPSQAEESRPRDRNLSSFPHAFERWEMLSSHWEGLTSHWIRRLEQNSEEVRREPLSQQMSRQITDLSAAGANLFHSIVELQRLRASSERKFQRWFFETRAEQERSREVQAELEATIRKERQQKAEAVQRSQRIVSDKENSDKVLREMRRELQISREEARRAWEELGRMENLERDRMASLRDGRPTLVGKIQVVPTMSAGAPSRQGSVNRPPEAPQYSPQAERQQQYPEESEETYPRDSGFAQYAETTRPEEDPFIEASRHPEDARGAAAAAATAAAATAASRTRPSGARQYQQGYHPSGRPSGQPQQQSVTTTTALSSHVPSSQAPVAMQQSSTSAPFYQQQAPTTEGRGESGDEGSYRSRPSEDDTYGDVEYVIDEHGQYARDAQGRPMVYSRGAHSEGSEEPDIEEDYTSERYHQGPGGGPPHQPSSAAAPEGPSAPQVQTGGGTWTSEAPGQYASAQWDTEIVRHHHPTRLSDVLEEDERSRTSASRASMSSRR